MNNHLQTVASVYEAFGKGDIPAIINLLSEDVCWEEWADNSAQKAGVPWLKSQKGKAGVMEFFKIVGSMKINEFKVLSLMAGSNKVAAEILLDADVPESGTHFRDEEMHLWTFDEEGKITGLRHYTDTHKHILAAGVLV